jgi:phosphocarrier protein HPr
MNPPSTQDFDAEKTVAVGHGDGLHMRPAMQFVDCANGFSSRITVTKDNQAVDGKSIMQITILAATKGTQLTVGAVGPDAQEAVDALTKLLANEQPDGGH